MSEDLVIVYRCGGIDSRVKHITHKPESDWGNRVSLCGARIFDYPLSDIRRRYRACLHCQRVLRG
jgi:hypothetical protein